MKWDRWVNPRHKIITGDRAEECARTRLLHLIDLLERKGISEEELEQTIDFLREQSLGGLSYHIMLLEEDLGIPKEDRTPHITYWIPEEETLGRVKRITKVKKEKRPQRGGLFG